MTSGSVWCVVVEVPTVPRRHRGTGSATSAMPRRRPTRTGTSTSPTTPTRTSTARRCCGSSAGDGTTHTATMATPAISARPRPQHNRDVHSVTLFQTNCNSLLDVPQATHTASNCLKITYHLCSYCHRKTYCTRGTARQQLVLYLACCPAHYAM